MLLAANKHPVDDLQPFHKFAVSESNLYVNDLTLGPRHVVALQLQGISKKQVNEILRTSYRNWQSYDLSGDGFVFLYRENGGRTTEIQTYDEPVTDYKPRHSEHYEMRIEEFVPMSNLDVWLLKVRRHSSYPYDLTM